MRQGDTKGEIRGAGLELGSLLYGVLGGPLAWSAHLLTSYFLVALYCSTGRWAVHVALAAVTAVLAVAAGLAALISFRRWRQHGGGQAWDAALSEPHGRGGFLWILGVLLGAVFALAILLGGLAPLFVPVCAPEGAR